MKQPPFELQHGMITLAAIDCVKSFFVKEDLDKLERKCNELLSTMVFKYVEDRALAEHTFKLGYFAAHIDYPVES